MTLSGAQAAEMQPGTQPGDGVLTEAAGSGDGVKVKRLLADGADINERGRVSGGAL